MNITLTGSTGHINRPLIALLTAKGHQVTVISSNPAKQQEIEALGAKAATGSIADAAFLTQQFSHTDAAYCMIPPSVHFSPQPDMHHQICANFATAIRRSGVQRVIHLSSVGAHMAAGSGLIRMHYDLEQALKDIPGIALTHMRPVGFYYNLYGFIPLIKAEGAISANYGADAVIPWVAPEDIATAIADELDTSVTGRNIRYVASDVLTCSETAAILGRAINMPGLAWNLISDEAMQQRLVTAGLPEATAEKIVAMNAAMQAGLLQEDYFRNPPAVMGRQKMADFATGFAAAFHQNN